MLGCWRRPLVQFPKSSRMERSLLTFTFFEVKIGLICQGDFAMVIRIILLVIEFLCIHMVFPNDPKCFIF